MDPRIQLPTAGVLMATPWWSQWLSFIQQGAGTIAAICGAIIGVAAVYRLWKNRQ